MTVNPDRVRKAFEAVAANDLRTLQLMVKAGVPIDTVCGVRNSSLLSHAARAGHIEPFHWLVKQGADTSFHESTSWGRPTSLVECACEGLLSPEIVAWILENTSVDGDDLGRALITTASKDGGAEQVVEMLLRAGADPDFADDDQETAVFVAVVAGAEEVALNLLRAGGSPLIRTRSPYREKFSRKTAYEVARQLGLESFCQECRTLYPEIQAKRPKIERPKTIEDCWRVITQHIVRHSHSLPEGLSAADEKLASSFAALDHAPVLTELARSWSIHNGSNGIGIFPVASDVTYVFSSFEQAFASRDLELEVANADTPGKATGWATWIPFAENGGGDYLVIDAAAGSDGKIARWSHETKRLRKVSSSLLAMLQRIAVEIAKERLCFDSQHGGLV